MFLQNIVKGPIHLKCFTSLFLGFQNTNFQSALDVFPTVPAKYRMTEIIKVNSIDISPCLNNHKINNFLLENTNKPTLSPFSNPQRGVIMQ